MLDGIGRFVKLKWTSFNDVPGDQCPFRDLFSVRQQNHLHGFGRHHISRLCLPGMESVREDNWDGGLLRQRNRSARRSEGQTAEQRKSESEIECCFSCL